MNRVTATVESIEEDAPIALAIGGPGFILTQESRGQHELVKS
jgi:hypothetical protein